MSSNNPVTTQVTGIRQSNKNRVARATPSSEACKNFPFTHSRSPGCSAISADTRLVATSGNTAKSGVNRTARPPAINGATGGDSTVQGLQRLQAKVLDQKPDLILIGFGMNDHNRGGVPIPEFEANLLEMIARIRATTGAEVVLFSAFPPNPRWKFGSHRMEQYASATSRVAKESGAAFADVYGNWQSLASRKKPEDLLGNNINHPNDFGHWVYFRVLDGLGL
jgi:lysophospholipase L1-like esterase